MSDKLIRAYEFVSILRDRIDAGRDLNPITNPKATVTFEPIELTLAAFLNEP
jgi:hypothetical protein